MDITCPQICLLILWSLIAGIDQYNGMLQLHRPLVSGCVVGWILGDLHTGLIAGAVMEMAVLGLPALGGIQLPNVAAGGVLGAFFAVALRMRPEAAAAAAFPFAVVVNGLIILLFNLFSFWMQKADEWARQANEKGIAALQLAGMTLQGAACAAAVFLPVVWGREAAGEFAEQIPAWVVGGLGVAGGMLPAVGLAMLMRSSRRRGCLVFLFAGFVLASYFQIYSLGIAAAAICVAGYDFYRYREAYSGAGKPAGENSAAHQAPLLQTKDFLHLAWRSLFLQGSYNYSRMQAGGWLYAIMPVLKKCRREKQELSAAMSRHLEYFNTHPFFVTFIMGIVAALEEKKADADFIRSVKTALMDSLNGIGDSVFRMTLLPLTAAYGASVAMGLTPDVTGVFLFLALFNAVHLAARFFLLRCGYRQGLLQLERIQSILPRIADAWMIVAMMVTGQLIAAAVHVRLLWAVPTGQLNIGLQENLFNGIMPNLLPLLYTFLMYALLRRKFSPSGLVFFTIALGLAGRGFGFL